MVEQAVVAGVLFFAALLTAGLAVLSRTYRSEPGAQWFTGVAAISAILIVMDTIELLGSSWLVLFVIEWAGTALYITIPVVWFCFILSYVGYGQLLTRRRVLLLFSIPGVSVLAMVAMEYNDLYFATFDIYRQGGRVVVETLPGPLAYLALLYSYTLFLVGLSVVVRMIVRGGKLFSGQAIWLLLGTLAPMTGGLLTAFGPNLEAVFPPFPIGLSIFTLAFGYGLFRHRIFDLTPATRNLGTTTAVESLGEGIIVLNTDGTVVTINNGACELFNCERDAVLGESIERIHPELNRLDDRQQPIDISFDGRIFEVTTSSVEGVRQREIGHAIVVRDVTTQRSQKQRLSVLNRVLRHNLRNDLMVVQAFAGEIEEHGDGEIAEHAGRIVRKADDLVAQAEKARQIQENFNDSAPSPETVDLGTFLASVVERAQSGTRAVPVAVDAPTESTVTVDTRTLELVAATLVENAIKYGTPDEWTSESGEAPVRLAASVDGGTLSITIADDGPGLPPEEYAVLDADEETKLDHGSGLGLWLAKWGTARLGGALSFEIDDGTTVEITVPLLD